MDSPKNIVRVESGNNVWYIKLDQNATVRDLKKHMKDYLDLQVDQLVVFFGLEQRPLSDFELIKNFQHDNKLDNCFWIDKKIT